MLSQNIQKMERKKSKNTIISNVAFFLAELIPVISSSDQSMKNKKDFYVLGTLVNLSLRVFTILHDS